MHLFRALFLYQASQVTFVNKFRKWGLIALGLALKLKLEPQSLNIPLLFFAYMHVNSELWRLTWTLVVPMFSPVSVAPSVILATRESSTFNKSFTNSVTSTCQSLPSRKSGWPRPSPGSASKCVRTRTVVLWYCGPQPRSRLLNSSSSSSADLNTGDRLLEMSFISVFQPMEL